LPLEEAAACALRRDAVLGLAAPKAENLYLPAIDIKAWEADADEGPEKSEVRTRKKIPRLNKNFSLGPLRPISKISCI
jgi:hypothetical protein